MTEKFSELEKKLLFDFLEELSDYYSNAGCNDFEIPNTPEGRLLFTAACRHGYDSQEDANRTLAEAFEDSGETIATIDSLVLGYIKHKLKNLLQ